MLSPDRSDMQLYYAEHGSGTPAVLLHGSASTGAQWCGLTRAFGAGFAVFTPDLAGYGSSRARVTAEAWTLWDEARFLAPLFQRLEEPAHLIGHSFGGAVALAAACLWPEHVASMTLYEPTLFALLGQGDDEDRAALVEVSRTADEILAHVACGQRDRAMQCYTDYWNGEGTWRRLLPGERFELAHVAGKVSVDFRTAVNASFDQEQLSAVQCPTLVVAGERSPASARRVADLLAAQLAQAQRVTLAGVGHMAPVAQPELTAECIQDALRKNGRSPSRATLRSAA